MINVKIESLSKIKFKVIVTDDAKEGSEESAIFECPEANRLGKTNMELFLESLQAVINHLILESR